MRLARIDPLSVLRVFLGAVLITVWFENLAYERYTAAGYERLIERYAERNDAPGFWSDGVMAFFADNSDLFAPVQAVTEMAFGLLLVLGLAAGAVGLVAALFLFSLWLSELGIFWIWELLGLTFVALAVGLGNLPALLRGTVRMRVLGWRTWGASVGLGARVAAAPVLAFLLWLAIHGSGTGARDNGTVALGAALVFMAAMVAGAFLDERRPARAPGGEPVA
jgi:uncharacterized membrane protein YphA (DoxX/SURF4 family)